MRRSTSWWRASSGDGPALLALLLTLGCTTSQPRPAPPTGPARLTLLVSADVKGYLAPCGCSLNMRGGIARAAHVVHAARGEGVPVVFIDGGDGLFGAASLPPEAVAQQEAKARTLAKAWKAMGLAARATGALDDARGADFRRGLGLPETAPGRFTLVGGDARVAVVNAADIAPAQALAEEARKAGARFVVAFVPAPAEELQRRGAEAPSLDLLVSTRPRDELAAEENRAGGGEAQRVVQLQSKGRSLVRVDLVLRGDGRVAWLRGDGDRERELQALDERLELLRAQVNEPMLGEELKALRQAKLEEIIARRAALAEAPLPVPEAGSAATLRFVPLESTLPTLPEVAALEREYDVAVGLLNLAWAKEHGQSCPPATAEAPGLVGSAVCIACHQEAGAVWRGTKHPKAYASLVGQGKQHHLDCVGCHVTGWRQPQGVCRIDETAGREEVGCEACHGPGSAHLAQPVKGNIPREAKRETCVRCHDLENSPHFDFEAWLPKVLGPGHGRPKAPGGAP